MEGQANKKTLVKKAFVNLASLMLNVQFSGDKNKESKIDKTLVDSIATQLEEFFGNPKNKISSKDFNLYLLEDYVLFSENCFKNIFVFEGKNCELNKEQLKKNIDRYKSGLDKRQDKRQSKVEKYDCADYYTASEEPGDFHWMTNLDIDAALQVFFNVKFDTSEDDGYIRNISNSPKNVFVCPSFSLDTLNQVWNNLPTKFDEVLVPVNIRNRHWVCVKIGQKEGQKTLTYIDSLGSNKDKRSKHYQKEAIKRLNLSGLNEENIDIQYTGKQCDSFRCGDYCIQQILLESGLNFNESESSVSLNAKAILKPNISGDSLRRNVLMAVETHYILNNKPIELDEDESSLQEGEGENKKKRGNFIEFEKNFDNKWQAVELINCWENLKNSKDSNIENIDIKLNKVKKTNFAGKISYNDNTEVYVKKQGNTCQVSTPDNSETAFRRLIEIAIAAGATEVKPEGPHAEKIKNLINSEDKFKNKLSIASEIKDPKFAHIPPEFIKSEEERMKREKIGKDSLLTKFASEQKQEMTTPASKTPGK